MSATRPLSPLALGLAAFGLVPAVAQSAGAQYVDPPPPAAYGLEGVTLVRADGRRTPGVTVVIRQGLIEAVGPAVTVPPDAKRLEGDSLFVYPGIVDAHAPVDYDFEVEDPDRAAIASWNPPRDVQGYLPHRLVVDALTATGDGLKKRRQQGVVAGAVHPVGPLMPGRGALVLYRPRAATARELVVSPVLPPIFTFERPRGVYPSTVFGAVAFYRQVFESARHDGVVHTAHAQDPRGLTIPPWDPAHSVLRDVMAGQLPVYFAADDAEDIRQVLRLSETYGFRPIIVGGDEAGEVADLLRARSIPVLVSVDFPKPERWKPDDKAAATDTSVAQEELDPAVLREKRRLEALYANPARLAESGVRFALTSGGADVDLRAGVRKTVEYGLTEAQALTALTSAPAELLGAAYLARVEAGMAATFVVTDGPLFGEQTRVAYTFVEGALEKGAPAKSGGSGDSATVDVSGTWDVEVSFQGEVRTATLTLEQEGGSLSGSAVAPEGTRTITSGSVSGNDVRFSITFQAGDQSVAVTYTGTVEGDEITGEVATEFGNGTWKATRTGGPGDGR
jgi:imidazolonepropionase-like amidohydrolase